MTKFLLVEGGLSSGNRGVDAFTMGSMSCLREFYPGAQFVMLGFTSPTSVTSAHELILHGEHLSVLEARTSFHNGVQTALRTCFVRAPTRDVAMRYFWWADVVIDLSAGDGFGDTYGVKVLLRHSLGKFIAVRLGKPLAVFPQTMGPFRTKIGHILAQYLLRRASLVCVREKISEGIARELLGSARDVARLSDMAFLMDEVDISSSPQLLAELPCATRPIGVNVSAFLWNHGHEIYGARKTGCDYQGMMVSLVRRLVQETDKPVLLVPHVFSANPRVCDAHTCKILKERLDDLEDRVSLLSRDYAAPEIKAIIGQCEFFVGSRMHACIAALSTGTPVVPVSYSHKFAGILEHFGVENWLVDPGTLSQQQAIDLVLSGYDHRDEIRKQIVAALPSARSEAMQAGRLLKMALPGAPRLGLSDDQRWWLTR